MGIAMPLVQPEIYQAVVEALAGCEPAALCTVVNSEGSVPGKRGAKMLVYADGRQLGTVGFWISAVLAVYMVLTIWVSDRRGER